jgi:aminopeptidase
MLKAWRRYLDAKQYAGLHLRGPGTDLKVGLPRRHLWMGGLSHSAQGMPFIANMPTEEVFTAPHCREAEGVVRSTKPLSHAGALIEDFELRFAQGKVVGLKAARNEAVLAKLIETDAGASRLGELALVPHSSPISQSGLLFYNTLYDENASCHLALGRAYRICVENGAQMSDEAFAEAGGNDSLVHTDFMIGSDRLDVSGILADGSEEPLMRAGEWVSAVTSPH